MTPTYQFLHAEAPKPFVWGHSDCALFMADWFRFLHGRDPAEHLRGAYDSALSCERVCGWFSDPVTVVEGCMSDRGGCRIEEPHVGCVGVVAINADRRVVPVGAVLVADGVWGVRAQEKDRVMTLNFRAAQPVAMWDIGYAP